MTSRYDAKYLRESGLRRRPFGVAEPRRDRSPRDVPLYRRLPPPIGAPEGWRDVNGVPIAPPGAVVPGRTRSGPILVR